MELDDFKSAWQSLDARLALQNRLQLELLHERRFDRARRNLRPLLFGMGLQAALGLFLVLLGIACWKQNLDVPGLLANGIALHAFGVLHIALAGLVGGLALSLDYAAPVLAIQKRLRLLLRLQVFNSNACGAPWWVMWVLVVVAFAGLGPADPAGGTPLWIRLALALGVAGWLATYALAWLVRRRARRAGREGGLVEDSGAIRRGRALLDEIAEFERG